MPIENLISLQGTLAETFSQLDPSTIQHADEITAERGTNEELRNHGVWTADGALYTVEDNQPVLYLTRGKDNPIFKNIQEAAGQLILTHNYVPKKEDLETAINSEDTLKVKLLDLNLQNYSSELSIFEIDTERYDQLNPEPRKVVERAYGQGNDFQENMKMLKKAGINTTHVYVLTPNYVKKHAEKEGAIARPCWLFYFGGGSSFDVGDRGVVCSDSRLRGVPREIAEGSAENLVKLE